MSRDRKTVSQAPVRHGLSDNCRLVVTLPVFAVLLVAALSAVASTELVDETFDLADYTITTLESGGLSIDTSQTLTQGNPGAALQTLATVPNLPGTHVFSVYLMHDSWTYEPLVQGPLRSIDLSADAYFYRQPGSLTTLAYPSVLFQDGEYYCNLTLAPALNGEWTEDINASGLQAQDYDRITDLLLATVDENSHPDFDSGGHIIFGTALGSFAVGGQSYDIRIDNLFYTINADSDDDGVLDIDDNCTLRTNSLQTDANNDSIGNACDPDVAGPGGPGDDDCVVNFLDLSAFKAGFFGNDPVLDLTGPAGAPDGQVNFFDLGRVKAFFFSPPGPSASGCN